MEPEETEDYEQISAAPFESFQSRTTALADIKVEKDIDVSELFSSSNFNTPAIQQRNENANILSGIYGRVRWKRPENGVCEICNLRISASNWSRHLKRKHADNLKSFLRSPDRTNDYLSVLHTSSTEKLNFSLSSGLEANGIVRTKSTISNSNNIHLVPKTNRLFTLFVATSGLSAYDLENEFLARFLASIPNFKLPESSMESQMNQELNLVEQKVSSQIQLPGHCLAISSQIGLAEFSMSQKYFLGFCVHFWDECRQSIQCLGIDVISLTLHQTNADVLSDLIVSKLSEIGSTRQILHHITSCNAYIRPSFFKPTDFGENFNNHSNRDELEDIRFEDSDLITMSNFYANESSNVFAKSDDLLDITCASTKLRGVLREICEQDATLLALRNRIFEVLLSITNFPQVFERLYNEKLLFPADSQWSTLYLTYSRILEILDKLNAICIDFNLPTICADHISMLREIVVITTPFEKFIKKLEQDNRPTISLLLPGLLHLLVTLKTDQFSHLPSIRPALETKVLQQFSRVLEMDPSNADSVYLCSSILDPTVAFLLDDHKTASITAIRQQSCSILNNVGLQIIDSNGAENMSFESVELPFGFGTVEKPRTIKRDKLDVEISSYLVLLDVVERVGDPIAFWTLNSEKFPLLSQIAKTVLAFPATASSTRKLISFGLNRNRNVSVENVRRKALLRFNKSMIYI